MKNMLLIVVAIASLASFTACEKNEIYPSNFVSNVGTVQLDTMYWGIDDHLVGEASVQNFSGGNEKIYLSVSHLLSENETYENYLTTLKNTVAQYEPQDSENIFDPFISPQEDFEIMVIVSK